MEKKRVFLSDLHMNDERSLCYPDAEHHYGWLTREEAQAIASFLSYVAGCNDVAEVILLGDVVDTWVCPVHLQPQTFEGIFTAQQNVCVVEQLKQLISKGIKLTYVIGNHDLLLTDEILQQYIPGINFIRDKDTLLGYYGEGKLRGEHGNRYAMFNAPDADNGMPTKLPLGYFISRIVATKVSKVKENIHAFADSQHDLLTVEDKMSLPESVVDVVLLYSGVDENDPIIMPDGTSVTAKQVKEQYAALYRQWVKKYGPDKAFQAALAELGYLGYAADELSKEKNLSIVLFGHTHIEKIEENPLSLPQHIYANTGTWCESPKHPFSYVETQQDEQNTCQHVRLMNWVNNKPVTIEEKRISL
ncbi:MAG: putative metallophosphoesterase [Bacteroidetes bacterium]|jgi:UDP-2,3-diacylglucosamine pyrophosphatase LpxH|nr:putative metallophosphoesterase [Bacteroidota bacterium]